MCGIFFIKNSIFCKEYIEGEFKKCQARGPDASNFIETKLGYLGFHRLAINGLTQAGIQPFIKHNCYLICNGEIYNYKNLYMYLKNKSENKSDCEVILDLYHEFGIEYTCKVLDGVFAFVLIDFTLKVVHFARDPLGVRPLYFFNANPVYGAASELKSLHTFNGKVQQFPPGCYSTITQNKMNINRYFSLNNFIIDNLSLSLDLYNYYTNIVRTCLISAVKKRLMSDRPIACLLSGGLDSSLIVSIITKLIPSHKIKTFSIGFEGSPDLMYAKEVSAYLRTDHTEVIVTEDEFFNAIPEVIKAIESYDTTTVRASVGNYLVAKYISTHCDAKVIFNGDGSDELTGGYLYFHNSPSKLDSDYEVNRLLSDIYLYDVLRSDKSISSCGLEPRTPFLDKSFVMCYKSIPLEYRFREGEIEKKLLRDSFEGFLPGGVLYRRKEAFSDGVSANNRSWYKIIEEKVNSIELPNIAGSVIHNVPKTKEQEYYRYIFEKEFPHNGTIVPYFWMPKWVSTNDPSARTIQIN